MPRPSPESWASRIGELFDTGHDEANRAVVAAVPADELDLVGIAFRAERRIADRVVDRLRFHP